MARNQSRAGAGLLRCSGGSRKSGTFDKNSSTQLRQSLKTTWPEAETVNLNSYRFVCWDLVLPLLGWRCSPAWLPCRQRRAMGLMEQSILPGFLSGHSEQPGTCRYLSATFYPPGPGCWVSVATVCPSLAFGCLGCPGALPTGGLGTVQ